VTFRKQCRKIAEELANQIQEYAKCGIKLKLVIGVNGNPSCGVNETSGILTEELRFALDNRKISVPFYGIHYECLKDDVVKLKRYIE
jgi:predicted secreted protein